MTDDLRLPSEWEEEFGYRIMDPDGWDRANFTEDWAKPISREEFARKSSGSTVEHLGAYRDE